MTLSALIRKRENATATLATPATHKGARAGTVANVASVAVANQLLAEEETAIRVWLAHIEETDPATIADVLARCQSDAQARAYCLEQARQTPPPPEPDYTATCGACRHFQRIDHPNLDEFSDALTRGKQGRHFQRIDHPHLGHCAQGEPEAPAGLWDTDRRWCMKYEASDHG